MVQPCFPRLFPRSLAAAVPSAAPPRPRRPVAIACGILFAFLALSTLAAPPAPLDCALAISPTGAWIRQFAPDNPLPPGADAATLTRWGPTRLNPADSTKAPTSLLFHTSALTASLRYELTTGEDDRATLLGRVLIASTLPVPLRPREVLLDHFTEPPPPPPVAPLGIVDPDAPLASPWRPAPPPPPGDWQPLALPPVPEIPANATLDVVFTNCPNPDLTWVYELDWRSTPWPTPPAGAAPRRIAEIDLPSTAIFPPAAATMDARPALAERPYPAGPLRLIDRAPATGIRIHRPRPNRQRLPGDIQIDTHRVTIQNTTDAPGLVRLLEPIDLSRNWTLDASSSSPTRLRPNLYAFQLTVPPASAVTLEWALRHNP